MSKHPIHSRLLRSTFVVTALASFGCGSASQDPADASGGRATQTAEATETAVAADTTAASDSESESVELTDLVEMLSITFDPRNVEMVEAGDFRFPPGQVAPIHTHVAPAAGYVVKGEIIFQIEGGEEQLLREGDAFYEPAGPRILRFDNASATQEAIFIDFNLQRAGEPFIVFEEELEGPIDRRMLQTTELGGVTVGGVEVTSGGIEPGGRISVEVEGPVIGYVALGAVLADSNDWQSSAGENEVLSFPSEGGVVELTNESMVDAAKVIFFQLEG